MRFLHTMVRVKDLDESMKFYCDYLGLEEFKRIDSQEARFSLIYLGTKGLNKDQDSPLIELTYNWPDENNEVETYQGGRNFGHIAFEVEDIYKTCQELMDNGITINRPPRDGFMAFIKSPDGISIELLQKGQKLEKAEPWISMENIGSW